MSRSHTLSGALPALCLALAATACGSPTEIIGADEPAANCDLPVTTPPASLGLDPFYQKYLDATGVPVLGSSQPQNTALAQACVIVVRMLAARPDVRQAMIADDMRVAVLALDEVTTDIPEYRDLDSAFPGTDWDALRGIGATTVRPVTSAGEENLLCLSGDPYHGQNILVQLLGSAIHLGISAVDPAFDTALDSDYQGAIAAGLWADTYAAVSADGYFTEAVQDWFDANIPSSPPNGSENAVATRAALQSYDPTLAALVAPYLPSDDWRAVCP